MILKFNRETFIKNLEIEERKKEEEEKFKILTKEISDELKKEGVPTTEDGRINMASFDKVYSSQSLKKDQKLVEEYEKEWYPNFSKQEIKKAKLKSDGEKLEILETWILNKFLKQDFIIIRTSPYDDIKNSIDIVILEKKTNGLICGLDATGEFSKTKLEEKEKKILENIKSKKGGILKYGLKIEKDKPQTEISVQGKQDKTKLVLGEITNIPVFYLGLPKRHIEQGIKKITPAWHKKSDCENKLFKYFISSINIQIQSLKLNPRLNSILKERIDNFEKIIQKYIK